MMKTVIATLALALVLTPTALAWPPCTCDPNPVTDLAQCLVNGTDCPPAVGGLDLPEPNVKGLVEQLDPRNWPCTCDPMPSPLDGLA